MDIAKRYDDVAQDWGEQVSRLGYPAAYRGFLNHIARPQGRVLDVGTGSGLFAGAWLDSGGSRDLTLLDPSAPMLEAAQSTLTRDGIAPTCVQGRLETFVPRAAFDTILGAHVLEHVDDLQDGLRQLHDMLAPGGQLLLVVSRPHWCQWFIWLRYRHTWFAPSEVISLAESVGLTQDFTHAFEAGPPSRTSLGYRFLKPRKDAP